MKHFNFPKFLISVFLILFLCACTAHKCVTEGIKNTEICSESGSNKMTYIQNTTITSYSHETGFLNDNLSSTRTMKQTRCPSSELSITETIENNKSTFYWTTKEYINSPYSPLNCQSEVRIFEVKNEKYPKFTLTKRKVLNIDISRFSEPEEATTNEVGMTLTGW